LIACVRRLGFDKPSAMARGDVTDEQWALIEPHLPIAASGPIPDLRKHFNAVMWRFRVGSPWRDLPAEFGPWQSAYDRFRIWVGQGVFQQLMDAMIAEAAARGEADLGLVSVDSATARAHHHAAGMTLDSEQLAALEAAVESEKGAKQRDKSRKTDRPRTTRASSDAGSADDTGPAWGPLSWDALGAD
jgi:transposase